MIIRNARQEDIESVAELEKRIEKEKPATKGALASRLRMFPEGFYLSEEENRIMGYAESCLWDKSDFEKFDEIRDFPANHNPEGKTLYVIFLGVEENNRRRGIGSELIRKFQKYARDRGLDKVQLVAGEGFLVDFYRNLGFNVKRELPDFLPNRPGTLMEYKIG